jgi:glycosyltransferase involved in cell wall biosynthesis
MKIGIDIRPLSFLKDMAGIYQHIYNLISNFLDIDFQNEYTLLSTLKGFQGNGEIPGSFIKRFPGRLSELLLERLNMPIEFLISGVDIFHGPCFFIPRHLRCRSIVTMHDLMAFRHPELLNPEWVVSIKKKVYASAKRADAIIAVSEFTKGEIVELLNIPEERIRVIYNDL